MHWSVVFPLPSPPQNFGMQPSRLSKGLVGFGRRPSMNLTQNTSPADSDTIRYSSSMCLSLSGALIQTNCVLRHPVVATISHLQIQPLFPLQFSDTLSTSYPTHSPC